MRRPGAVHICGTTRARAAASPGAALRCRTEHRTTQQAASCAPGPPQGAGVERVSASSVRTALDCSFRKTGYRRILETTLIFSLLLFLSGCGTTYLQPPVDPPEPRAVFVVDHGRHTSLVLVTDTGDMVRYAYGDWRYYADQDTRLRSGFAALFCRTPSTLARRDLEGPPEEAVLLARLRVGVQTIHLLEVRGSDADRLRAELDALHAQGADQHQYVAVYDLVFAPHPEPYTWRNNSATKIGEWLEAMEVLVKGPALVSRWEVVRPE